MSRAVLVARDRASSQAGELLHKEFRSLGFDEVFAYLGNGNPIWTPLRDIRYVVEDADVLWLGMSSSPELSEPELAAAEAAFRIGVPYGFYSDTFGCYARPWFAPYRDKASFVFVLNDEEKTAAEQLFPRATALGNVVATGNPNWEEFAFPRVTRQQVREKLGIPENDYLIVCPGTKSVPIGSFVWIAVINALNELVSAGFTDRLYRVILAPHPDDATVQKEMNVYADLEKYSGAVSVRFVSRSVMVTQDIITGADIVVTQIVASTEGMRAAYLGIPTVCFLSVVGIEWSVETHGTRFSPPAQMGIADAVYTGDSGALAQVIQRLLTPEGSAAMRAVQRAKCVVHERGYAIKEMARVLTEIARSR
ncbi:MAG: hypothetical protein G01um101470_975 [Parcubacteria group bacterium Gr01-1014_70]|nr:MAG: hypothetical protein G01um101470_975 [Parcubacteria group bacterium Gr01-1014_70]